MTGVIKTDANGVIQTDANGVIQTVASATPQFEVAITSTNSPVPPGDTLGVTTDVTNTGGAQGTQTITLDINNGVGQVDSASVTLSAGSSAIQALSWSVPSGQTAQDYTATVASADDSASQTVTVGATVPSSAVLAYDPATFTTGDSTWADQAGAAQDMSLSGNIQAATLSNGNAALSSDGVDDHGLTTFPSALEGSQLQNFAVELEIEHTSSGFNAPFSLLNSGGQSLQLSLNFDYDAVTQTDGHIGFILMDNTGSQIRVSPTTNPNLDDGNRHTVVFDVLDSSANDVDIYIDGTAQTLVFDRKEGPDNFVAWSADMAHFARNNSGTIDQHYPGKLGKVRWHDTDIGGPTV